MNDLIDRNSLLNSLEKFAPEKHDSLVEMLIKKEPTVDSSSCEGCVRDDDLQWANECFECARYYHDRYKRKEE